MSISIGQTTYNLVPDVAQPGQIADLQVGDLESFIAAELIQPGRLLTLASDGVSCQQAQESGDTLLTAGVLGVSVFKTARQGTGVSNDTTAPSTGRAYNPGETVWVMRRGKVWMEWKGTTQTAYSVPNYYHSSTTATDRGKLTDASPSGTGGSEVSTAPAGFQICETSTGSGNLALVSVNLPGAAS